MSKNKKKKVKEEIEVKLILLGDQGVGKTNLINIVTRKGFNINEESTSSASFSILKLKVDDQNYRINLWDTIGQEKYRQLTKLFFNNSKIVIFVYDITVYKSFTDLKSWHQELVEQVGNDIIKGVVANKNDLYENEKVKQNEAEEFAESINAKFLSISAKKDLPEKFEDFIRALLIEYITKGIDDDDNKISISGGGNNDDVKKNCCK